MNGSDVPPVEEVYQRALGFLARRDHSVVELKRKLASRGYPGSLVDDAVERLLRQGYLDDRRFARQWVDSALRSGKGYGVRLLMELQRRGVDRATADEAVSAAIGGKDERNLLAEIVAKRFSSFDPAAAPLKERRRVYGYLLRRGFSPAAISSFMGGRQEWD